MDSATFGYLRKLVKQQAAIVLEREKEYLAETRLASLARDNGFDSIPPMVTQLRLQPFGELHRRVIESLTTNETSFFRDRHPFDAMRTTIIPRLLASHPTSLTIWCAAASSGQEPYSVAMVIRDHFPRIVATTRIIASDLSREMLARVDRGTYTQFEVGRGLSERALAKHFVQRGADWIVRPELRAMLEVKELNLAAAFPALPRIDLVLVRNVLIYFDQPAKRDILSRIRRVMNPEGALVLGASETMLGLDTGLERCAVDKAIYYRPT